MRLNIIAFLGGVGFQELILLAVFFFVFAAPVALIVLLLVRRKYKVTPAPMTPVDMRKPALEYADKLKELKSLLDLDIISKEEFEREKSKILDRKS